MPDLIVEIQSGAAEVDRPISIWQGIGEGYKRRCRSSNLAQDMEISVQAAGS